MQFVSPSPQVTTEFATSSVEAGKVVWYVLQVSAVAEAVHVVPTMQSVEVPTQVVTVPSASVPAVQKEGRIQTEEYPSTTVTVMHEVG